MPRDFMLWENTSLCMNMTLSQQTWDADHHHWFCINPLTAGVAYIRVFIFYKDIKYHLFNMLKIKYYDIN